MSARAGARTRQRDNDIPPPEPEDMENEGREQDPEGSAGEGVEIDLDELPPERGAKKGGEERRPAEESAGPLERTDDREETRTRRREERQYRKGGAKDLEIERLRAENEANRERLARLEADGESRRVEGARAEVERIDAEMQRLERQYAEAKSLKEKAYKDNDGKSIVDADEALASTRESHARLGAERDRIVLQARREAAQPKVSKELVESARSFVAEHKWYDRSGKDRDSARVLALDRQMASEGWDPNTAGYWEELRERVREELPHKFDDGKGKGEEEERRPRGSPTGGSTRESGGGGGKNTFYLSPARVSALKEAGLWEDAESRARMIRRYKQRDEQDRRAKERSGR